MIKKIMTNVRVLDIVAILYLLLMINNIRCRDLGWVPVNILLLTVYVRIRIKEFKG